MYAKLFHIYGPLWINSFGVIIALAFGVFTFLLEQDPLTVKIFGSKLNLVLLVGAITGLLGGRIWYLLTNGDRVGNWLDVVAVWDGGLSVLGAFCAVLLIMPLFLRWQKIPIMPAFDLMAVYIPLLHGLSRLGCFFAGCCYGIACSYAWAVTYTDPHSMAPLGSPLHPVQLYSAIALVGIFLYMYFFARAHYTRPGQLAALYIFLAGAERFAIDFLRADQEGFIIFSYHQWLALILCIGGLVQSWRIMYR